MNNNSDDEKTLEYTREVFNDLPKKTREEFRNDTKTQQEVASREMDNQEAILQGLVHRVMNHNQNVEGSNPLPRTQVRPSEELDTSIKHIIAETQGGLTLWQTFMNVFKDEDTIMRQKTLILNERLLSHKSITNKLEEFSVKYQETNIGLYDEIMRLRKHFKPVEEELTHIDKSVQIQFPMKPSLIADYADVSTEPIDLTGGDD